MERSYSCALFGLRYFTSSALNQYHEGDVGTIDGATGQNKVITTGHARECIRVQDKLRCMVSRAMNKLSSLFFFPTSADSDAIATTTAPTPYNIVVL